ncbi:MAG: putative metal-binding motif-containing protein, partial [Saprospiraceae bacterium]
RYVDGRWGLVEGRTFYLYQPPLASTPNIDKLEYFFNTDPGVGNGTAIPINTGASVSTAIALPTTSLATGFHRLYVRARYVDGRWGLVETRSFYLYPTSTFPQNIVAAEVFFDTDPGVGQGTAISLGAAAPSIATNIQVTVPNLALGTHFLYLRAKFANGSWSLVERDTFTVLQVMYDAALSNLMHPNGGCGVTANSSIQVTLANNTNVALPVSAATLNLTVSGANTGSYTMVNPSSVPAFGSIVITFTGINLSNAGLNNLVATVTAPSDPNSANNTANATVTGVPGQTYYLDGDGDGFGNPAISTLACSQPAGYVVNNSDCNDANAAVHPNTVWYLDADNDGYYTGSGVTQCLSPGSGYHFSGLTAGGDCNDAVAAIHPGATENCDNSIDDNCNGQIDEGARFYFYADADGDGFGNSAVSLFTCVLPSGYVSDNTDCNDSNPTIHPGGSEICNNLDDDCDNSIDEGVQTNFYADIDGDGYGNPAVSTLACTAPAGYVSNNQDCNDDAAAIHPGQVENCNGLDDNCNGQVDEGVKSTFYADADGDGFGNLNVSLLACTAPAGYVADHTDCNDANAALHPGVPEICDAFDNNCDGQVNEGFTAVTYYRDLDQDGFGDPSNPQTNCAQPGGYVTNNLDCNDSNPAVNPSATELCGNTVDENCDGTVFYVCNDACADAQVLEVSSSGTCTTPVSGKVYDAGSEIASENLCGDVLSDPADSWYYFVATATAHRIHLAKTAPGTGGRIYFQLFQGSTCTALTYLEPSDCNYGSADVAGLLYTGFTPGIRYYVRVISQHSAVPNNDDDFTLCVTTPVLPTNETCAQATAITIPAGCSNTAPGLSFDLANANASAVSSCLPTAPDLWYTFQAVHDTYLV